MSMDIVVIGASGYAGGQLLRLIAQHPKVKLKSAIAHSKANVSIAQEHGFLTGIYDSKFQEFDSQKISKEDFVFMALPHGESAALASQLDAGTKVVDLGADFRLSDSSQWKKYYGGNHAGQWTYGLPEIKPNRELISDSKRVANPGCYATAISLAFAPLITHKLIDLDFLTVVAASGTTGAGKKPTQNLLASEVINSLVNYKTGGVHQHIPEIEQMLNQVSNDKISISFNPILAPMPRGILANCIGKLKKSMNENEINGMFSDHYKNEPFVKIIEENSVSTSSVIETNNCHLQVKIDQNTNQITVISVIDNLIKGASGQAIQNMNLMCGWQENLGLSVDL